jgi:hypothetical protein
MYCFSLGNSAWRAFEVIGIKMAGILGPMKSPGPGSGPQQTIIEVSASAKPSEVRPYFCDAEGIAGPQIRAAGSPEFL